MAHFIFPNPASHLSPSKLLAMSLLLGIFACSGEGQVEAAIGQPEPEPPTPVAPPPTNNQEPADLVVVNALIYTANPAQPRAAAMAISDGEITAIGSGDSITDRIGESTQVYDAQGNAVLPGFIDTHNHIFEGASEVGGNCQLDRDRNLIGQIPLLEICTRNIVQAGSWVIGYGHQLDALMEYNEAVMPRDVLDDVFPNNPVIIMEESSHSMLVNSMALEVAGIDSETPHPPGGRIMFDQETGEPNGILFDNAGDIVMERAWNAQDGVFQASYDGLLAGLEEMRVNGITTVGDGRMYWRRGWYEVWQQVLADGELTARISVRPWIYPEIEPQEQLSFLQRIQTSNSENLLLFNQVKMYVDGVMHFGTAKVAENYTWSWQENIPTGLYYITPDAMAFWLAELQKIGFGAHIHAIGDLGISQAIDNIATVRQAGSDQLYGLTHLEMVRPSDFPRFAEYDIDADFQAGATFFAEHSWAVPYIGQQRAQAMLQMRGVYDAGANVTFSSDWTVNELSPLVAIANSIRLQEGQGLPNIESAIQAATINGAKALGLESVTGSLEVGKFADFVVLSQDVTTLSADAIENTQVLATFLMGEEVFQSSP